MRKEKIHTQTQWNGASRVLSGVDRLWLYVRAGQEEAARGGGGAVLAWGPRAWQVGGWTLYQSLAVGRV